MMGNTISATATEKRKRGRPRIMGPDAERMASYVSPQVKSVRGRQEVFYRMLALDVLLKDTRFTWLANEAEMKAGTGRSKASILSELGRIHSVEDMQAIALRTCELKPKTKEATVMIRRFRIGKESPADPWTLFRHLAAAIDVFRERHPSVTTAALIDGLRDMANVIRDETEEAT